MTAPMVDYKIHWLKMMSVTESRAVVGRHDGINGRDRPLIGAVGEQFPEKGKQTEQGRQQRETAVAILNVGGGDDAVQQQALRIDQNMPLLALDQLAGIEAVAVDASPPFSALFTL